MNKAHEVLKAIGAGDFCGVWAKTKRYSGPTLCKSGKDKEDKRIAREVGIAVVLRNYFTRKNLEVMQAKRRKANASASRSNT